MQHVHVADHVPGHAAVRDRPASQDVFAGSLARQFNRSHNRPMATPVDKRRLIEWLVRRSDPDADGDGISVLENEVLRNRIDVWNFVQEDGAANVTRLRLWMITHGADELGMDDELLADTVEHVLSLRRTGGTHA